MGPYFIRIIIYRVVYMYTNSIELGHDLLEVLRILEYPSSLGVLIIIICLKWRIQEFQKRGGSDKEEGRFLGVCRKGFDVPSHIYPMF